MVRGGLKQSGGVAIAVSSILTESKHLHATWKHANSFQKLISRLAILACSGSLSLHVPGLRCLCSANVRACSTAGCVQNVGRESQRTDKRLLQHEAELRKVSDGV